MKPKRIISFMLCLVMFLSLLPSEFALATMSYMGFKNGAIEMQFEDTKASTGTTFHTVGWMIHRYSKPNMDAYRTDKVGIMIDEDYQETLSTDLGNGKVQTNFYIDSDTVDFALAIAEMGGISENEYVYLDSVFEVLKNGQSTGKYYYTYDDIASAAPWGSGTLNDLQYYYNRKIKYSSADHPLYKEIIVNGVSVSKDKIAESKTGIVHNVTFDPTMDYLGSTATIKKSYFYYELQQGKKLFELSATDSNVCNRNATMNAGGITVVAEYVVDPKVKVEHYNLDTSSMIETEPEITVKSGDTVTKSAKTYTDLSYGYSEVSEDGGSTWKLRATNSTRNIVVNRNTVIRFNYAKDTSLMASLTLTADPNIIDEGSTATVTFGLDASQSKADNGISKYEFWFSGTSTFEDTPNWTITENYKETSQANVAPNTTWYGKVRITDKTGKTAIATADITIGSQTAVPTAEISPNVELNLAGDNDHVENFSELIGGMNGMCIPLNTTDTDGYAIYRTIETYRMDILVDDDYATNPEKYTNMEISVQLDASDSTSTNDIGTYEYITNYDIYDNTSGNNYSTVQSGGNSVSKAFSIQLKYSPSDIGVGGFSNEYEDSATEVQCRMIDSAVDTCKADVIIPVQYRFVFNTAPDVQLAINKNSFGLGETAIFTPTFIEGTYPIASKSWSIQKTDDDFIVTGTGEIPSEYRISLAEGNYTARQYITYRDRTNNDITDYAEVAFDVYAIKPPTVEIHSDKEKYYIPTTGIFTVFYGEDPKYSYQIVDRDYEFRTESGNILASGNGTFPDTYYFNDTFESGYYVASQTIYWWQEGEYKSATSECTVKLISPVPVADFSVSMKMNEDGTDWLRLDNSANTGKVYKQLRIDLSPSTDLNTALENPNPINYSSPSTQIKITPVTQSVNSINTYTSADLVKSADYTLTSGMQYLDVRFDEPGDYNISCRVVASTYVSSWVTKTITIREDLPPTVTIGFDGVFDGADGYFRTFRNPLDLHVNFNVLADAQSQDEDTPDPDSAILKVRFDYNANMDSADDGVHSNQSITKALDNLQNYITASKSEDMSKINLDLHSNTFSILGKMYFEYYIADKPTIPNYTGGDLTAPPVLYGSTESQPVIEKSVIADNKSGSIDMEVGSRQKITITYIMGVDTPSIDLQALADYYGDYAEIYVVDKNSVRTRFH